MKKTGRVKGRKLINSKKHVVDGIQFASTLELRMYELLKEAGIKTAYEGKSYVLVDSFTYPVECYERTRKINKTLLDKRRLLQMKYTPDFIGENEEYIIEVKGMENESFPLRWKIFKNMIQHWEKPPILFKPMSVDDCRQVVEILKDKGYGRKKG